jgi:Zn-finger nucleic acid-binding protein
MTAAIARTNPTCPRCKVGLSAELTGDVHLHRCGACGGVWLDPQTFRAVCEPGTPSRTGGEPAQATLLPAKNRQGKVARPDAGGSAPTDDARNHHTPAAATGRNHPVRYLPCPTCDEIMNRVNFARVSGVILDVCRPHGAWFDAGELRAIRSFVRGPGLARFERSRALEAERARRRPATAGARGLGAGLDPIDVLADTPGPYDAPSGRSQAGGYLWAGVLALAGAGLLWFGFTAYYGAIGPGVIALVAAGRAFLHARARRR